MTDERGEGSSQILKFRLREYRATTVDCLLGSKSKGWWDGFVCNITKHTAVELHLPLDKVLLALATC